MFDVMTVGSATRDVYIYAKSFRLKDGQLCFRHGSKIDIDSLDWHTGGGGTNTAAAFASLGLKVAFVGKVGPDLGGQRILDELSSLGVQTRYAKIGKKSRTGYSLILPVGRDRTILVYRGANDHLKLKDIPELQTAWLYVAPLSRGSAALVPKIIRRAAGKNIKVAINPGSWEITHGIADVLRRARPKVLLMNKEEAAALAGLRETAPRKLLKKLHVLAEIAVVTDGARGAWATDGTHLYKAGVYKVSLVDKVGAGDAFCAGFVATLIKRKSVAEALRVGTANAASVIQKRGAKEGLLKAFPTTRLNIRQTKL